MTELCKALLLLASTVVAACSTVSVADPAPFANTTLGAVRGVASGDLNVFKGIPYAKPPVGELRWRPPVEKEPYEDVLDASEFGASCIQLPSSPTANSIYADDAGPLSEDCLLLNVWAENDADMAPVFVWIHGGALVSGSSRFGMYDGSSMARKGIVFVSINYRLGPLGYLAHPELSAESPAGISGNYGLQDQIAALRWIRDNIAAFGGDPDNVTIAGESAGALSVMYLMASPDARGLFQRAISQSGYMISSPELEIEAHGHPPAESQGLWLQEKLGLKDLAAMRAMDPNALTQRALQAGFLTWGTIDGHLLPRQLVERWERNEQASVPLLAGFNSGEIRSLRRLLPPRPAGEEDYRENIELGYGDLANRFLSIYPGENIDESMLATTRDAMYGWTAERMVRGQTALGQRAWLYLFDHGYPAAEAAGLHAFHAAEIPYALGTIDRITNAWPAVPNTASERVFADIVLDYWASFARGEGPHSSSGPDWQRYANDREIMVFGDEPVVRADGIGAAYALHDEVVCRRRHSGDVPWHWNVGVAAPQLPEASLECQ